jgi:hypothetical protein
MLKTAAQVITISDSSQLTIYSDSPYTSLFMLLLGLPMVIAGYRFSNHMSFWICSFYFSAILSWLITFVALKVFLPVTSANTLTGLLTISYLIGGVTIATWVNVRYRCSSGRYVHNTAAVSSMACSLMRIFDHYHHLDSILVVWLCMMITLFLGACMVATTQKNYHPKRTTLAATTFFGANLLVAGMLQMIQSSDHATTTASPLESYLLSLLIVFGLGLVVQIKVTSKEVDWDEPIIVIHEHGLRGTVNSIDDCNDFASPQLQFVSP